MSREPQSARINVPDADITSNTELVLDLVMPYLPTRDCVRTSILSGKWKNRWKTIPILMLDRNCCSLSFNRNAEESGQLLASIIDHVLLLHSGSMQVLKVQYTYNRQQYNLHPSVYTFGSLIDLEVEQCFLLPPPYFKGFKNLKRLCLTSVSVTDAVFEHLISSCPLLEYLAVTDFEGQNNNLKLDACNLQSLIIVGVFRSISFGQALIRMHVVTIFAHCCGIMETSLTKFLTNLPSIQRLELRSGLLSGFANDGLMPESTPFQCKDLYYLSIEIEFGRSRECMAALFILRSSPNLTELNVTASASESRYSDVWRNRGKTYWEFQRLQKVTVTNFHGSRSELEFVKFVLGNSPLLENMTIVPHQLSFDWRVVKGIYGFKRTSCDAEVIFDGHCVQKR